MQLQTLLFSNVKQNNAMKTIIKTNTFLFTTWVNCRQDDARLYMGSDGKIYCKRYGLPVEEITVDWAMSLAWFHINRTGSGWPKKMGENGIPTVSISKEAQDLQCKMLLKLN